MQFPDLQWDTFVTIGALASTTDFTEIVGTWPGFGASSLLVTGASWVRFPGGSSYDKTYAAEDGRVVLGQFTVPHGSSLTGLLNLNVVVDGATALVMGRGFDVPLCQPDAAGACCLPVACLDVTYEQDCITLGGSYMGDGTLCPAQLPPGDINHDCVVDVDDLDMVILDWGTDGSEHGGDIDGNGIVNVDDLTAIILTWGPAS
jgi:hypothetical protein